MPRQLVALRSGGSSIDPFTVDKASDEVSDEGTAREHGGNGTGAPEWSQAQTVILRDFITRGLWRVLSRTRTDPAQ